MEAYIPKDTKQLRYYLSNCLPVLVFITSIRLNWTNFSTVIYEIFNISNDI